MKPILYKIYQLPNDSDKVFQHYGFIADRFTISDYTCVISGELDPGIMSTDEVCDYIVKNCHGHGAFLFHPVSTSDVLELSCDGVSTSFYCNGNEYKELIWGLRK